MHTSSPCILLVEDDRDTLAMYRHFLEEYAPLLASDGVEAQKILSETRVDVVVCDLGMPRIGGIELMRWAKEHCPHPLWIVVSGQGSFDLAIQAVRFGAFDFIRKPLESPVQLRTAVANAARHQALVTERAQLLRSLADNNARLVESHHKLELANASLRDHQAILDQDLVRAARIVRALLPHSLPLVDQLQVNVACRPSTSIGGDFYGAVTLDDSHLAIYVADAAGHGVSAALLAVLFHQRLSLVDAKTGPRTPATVLCDLNRELFGECRASGLFVTAAYALVDTIERTATVASAGHPPVVLWRCTGASEHLNRTGPALGLAPDATYQEHRISLDAGDRLLLYTDGLTGAISERALSLDAILASVTTDADDGGTVIDRLLTWTDDDVPDDDMTVLLLTATSRASTFDAESAARHGVAPDLPFSIGSDGRTTWIAAHGRVTWKDAGVLRERSLEALDAGQSVIIDLAACTMLDSTILGTLHELVLRAASGSFQLQNATDPIRALFVELAMDRLLSSIAPAARPPPADMIEAPESPPIDDASTRELVLHTHELLADLSPKNAKEFQPVIDVIRAEAGQAR